MEMPLPYYGNTPLHWAAGSAGPEYGNENIDMRGMVEFLQQHGGVE